MSPPDPIGANTLTALSRRFLVKRIPDIIYESNALLHRWLKYRKRNISGGYQIEMPVLVAKTTTPKSFRGWEPLDVAEQDNIVNAAWDVKQVGDTVAVNRLQLFKSSAPEAKFNYLQAQFEQCMMGLQDKLGYDLQNDASVFKRIWGLGGAVDDGSVLPTYAGITRATYPGWASFVDDTSGTLSNELLLSLFLGCTKGARTPSVIVSNQVQWGRHLYLGFAGQDFPVGASGHDEIQYSPGFTSSVFMQIPWVKDEHVEDGPDTTNSAIQMLNEEFIEVGIADGPEFRMTPFISNMQGGQPQSGWVSSVEFMGEVMVQHPGLQGKLTNVAA